GAEHVRTDVGKAGCVQGSLRHPVLTEGAVQDREGGVDPEQGTVRFESFARPDGYGSPFVNPGAALLDPDTQYFVARGLKAIGNGSSGHDRDLVLARAAPAYNRDSHRGGTLAVGTRPANRRASGDRVDPPRDHGPTPPSESASGS